MYCSEFNNTTQFVRGSYTEKIAVYVRCCKLLKESLLCYSGQRVIVLTNNKKLLSSIEPSLEYEEIDFPLIVPEGIRFYSAHQKINVYNYLANISEDEYSVLIDSDIVCVNKMPFSFQRVIDIGIPCFQNNSDQILPLYTQEKVIADKEKVLALAYPDQNIRSTGIWPCGGFLGGRASFFAELFEICSHLWNGYLSVHETLFHAGDETPLGCALDCFLHKNKNSIFDISRFNIIGSVWSVHIITMPPPLQFFYNHYLLHLPADKLWLSNYLTEHENVDIIENDAFDYLRRQLYQNKIPKPLRILRKLVDVKYVLKRLITLLSGKRRELLSSVALIFNLRPSSKPFLAGDTYRALANCLYDNTHLCSASDINAQGAGMIIYASSYLLDKFCNEVLPFVKITFVLITHQSDRAIENSEPFTTIAENPYLLHWFAQNCLYMNKKITPLPIGLEDLWRHNHGELADYKKKSFVTHIKRPRILMCFAIQTNPKKRLDCYNSLKSLIFVDKMWYPPWLYRRTLRGYMFVASPDGNGCDCHRTWEAMYMRVVPLVEDNYMNRYFVSLGLPMYIVKDWNEIALWDESFMENLYHSIQTKSDTAALWLDYWVNQITDKSSLKQ
jgi:hypothetical protein